jgi:rhodanese-related sulfurtransferase
VKMPLRATISSEELSVLPKDATLIAYCIKDFRGYEVARALRRAGYNVHVMDDPGLQGWKKAKLPTAGERPNSSDVQALLALTERAKR